MTIKSQLKVYESQICRETKVKRTWVYHQRKDWYSDMSVGCTLVGAGIVKQLRLHTGVWEFQLFLVIKVISHRSAKTTRSHSSQYQVSGRFFGVGGWCVVFFFIYSSLSFLEFPQFPHWHLVTIYLKQKSTPLYLQTIFGKVSHFHIF